MKQVMIIAFDFPPQGASSAIRAAKLCKYLPDFGWWPTVICPDAVTRYDPSLLNDIPARVQVHRVKGPRLFSVGLPTHPSAMASLRNEPVTGSGLAPRIRRLARNWLVPDPQVLWGPSLVAAMHQTIEQTHPDALLTTAPPFSLHLMASIVKRRYPELPWVADYRDFWSPITYGLRRRLSVYLERRWLSRAEAVVFVNPTQRQQALEVIGQPNYPRAYVITNGFDAADFLHLREYRCRDEHVFVLAFVGSYLDESQNTQLFPALEIVCRDESLRAKLQVRIWGNFVSPNPDITTNLIEEGVLQITPFAPYQVALEAMWSADALFMAYDDTPRIRTTHANKLFEYLATGHPILAIVPEGEIASVIHQQQAGIVIHPNDRDGIVHAIRQMVERWTPESRHSSDGIERNGRYERREISRQMADLLDAVSTR
jgi:glycosyltransferase involved in cell wall biosynthesis